jgi:hypothetical protein
MEYFVRGPGDQRLTPHSAGRLSSSFLFFLTPQLVAACPATTYLPYSFVQNFFLFKYRTCARSSDASFPIGVTEHLIINLNSIAILIIHLRAHHTSVVAT